MRIIVWALWLILFVVLFGFAVTNTAAVELHMLGGFSWQAPLIALLLIFFLGGVLFGLLAALPAWFRVRMELRRIRKSMRAQPIGPSGPVQSGAAEPDSIQSVAQGARTTS